MTDFRSILLDSHLASSPRLRCSTSLQDLTTTNQHWKSSHECQWRSGGRSLLLPCGFEPNTWNAYRQEDHLDPPSKIRSRSPLCDACANDQKKVLATSRKCKGFESSELSPLKSQFKNDRTSSPIMRPSKDTEMSSLAKEMKEIRDIIENNASLITSIRGLTEDGVKRSIGTHSHNYELQSKTELRN